MCDPKFDYGRRDSGVRQRQPVQRYESSDGEGVVNGLGIDTTCGQFFGGKGDGEDDPEGGPGARHAAKGDAAAMVLDDLVGESEAKACPGGLGSEEWVEDFVGLGRGYPFARILDLDLDVEAGAGGP